MTIPAELDIRDFGATPSTPAAKVDCSAAVNAAIREYALATQTWAATGSLMYAGAPTIRFPAVDGFWYLASPVLCNRNLRFLGTGPASPIVAASGVTAFNLTSDIRNESGDGNAFNSIFDSIHIRQESAVLDGGFGIYTNVPIHVRDCVIDGFGNDNICIDADGAPGLSNSFIATPHDNVDGSMYGSANIWTMVNTTTKNSLRNGIRFVGNNSNQGTGFNVYSINNRGCGVLDQTLHGNQWMGLYVEGNGTIVAVPGLNHQVIVSGSPVTQLRLFICYSVHTANGTTQPGVGASWATRWYEFNKMLDDDGNTIIEATEADIGEYWTNDKKYAPTGSVHSTTNTQGSTYFGTCWKDAKQGPPRIGGSTKWLGGHIPNEKIRPIVTSNGVVLANGMWNRLLVNRYTGKDVTNTVFETDPVSSYIMRWGHSDEGYTVPPWAWSLRYRTVATTANYSVTHRADGNNATMRFYKPGVESANAETTIKRLEDRIALLEAELLP